MKVTIVASRDMEHLGEQAPHGQGKYASRVISEENLSGCRPSLLEGPGGVAPSGSLHELPCPYPVQGATLRGMIRSLPAVHHIARPDLPLEEGSGLAHLPQTRVRSLETGGAALATLVCREHDFR